MRANILEISIPSIRESINKLAEIRAKEILNLVNDDDEEAQRDKAESIGDIILQVQEIVERLAKEISLEYQQS